MFDKAKKVPEPGNLMEVFFLIIWKMRQDIEFQKSRATLQALLNQKGAEPKKIEEAFDDLRSAFFPFDKNQKKQEIVALKNTMMRAISHGPVFFEPMVDLDQRKMAARLARGNEALVRKKSQREVGQVVPIDNHFSTPHRRRK